MGAMIEKAETAFENLEDGFSRLSQVGDGLIESLGHEHLEHLKGLGRQIRQMAEDELARREKATE